MVRFRHVIGFSCVLLAGQAGSAMGDSFSPYGALTHIYDDNLLSHKNSSEARAALGSNDTTEHIVRLEGGIDMDLDLSRQNVFFRSNINRSWHDDYSTLDFTGFDFAGGLNWAIGRNCSGVGDVQWLRTAGSFTEFNELRVNERNRKQARVTGSCFVSPAVRLRGEGAFRDTDNSAESQKDLDRQDTAFEAGADYITRAGTLVGITGRVRRSKFMNRRDLGSDADKEHDQYFIGANFEWAPRRAITLSGLGGWTWRDHDSVSSDDFNDFNGDVNVDWAVTSAISLGSTLFYDTGGSEGLTTSATRNRGIGVDAVWAPLQRLRVFGDFSFTETEFLIERGDNDGRDDDTLRWSLGLNYQPLRFADFSVEYRGTSRDSSNRLSSFDKNIIETQVRVQF